MRYMYGRCFFETRAVFALASFRTLDLAKEYCETKNYDVFCDEFIGFILDYETNQLIFRTEEGNAAETYVTLNKAVVFDSVKNAEVHLSEYGVTEEEIIKTVKENL